MISIPGDVLNSEWIGFPSVAEILSSMVGSRRFSSPGDGKSVSIVADIEKKSEKAFAGNAEKIHIGK
ncbi:MAG: hypothetical protein V8T87_04405 [Victivallales bacterium]